MIDGIKFTCIIKDYHSWIQKTNLDFKMRVSQDTGEQVINKIRYGDNIKFVTHFYASLDSYQISLIKTEIGKKLAEIEVTSYRLIVKGSLHKNHHRSSVNPKGANYEPFSIDQLQSELSYIEKRLCLQMTETKIQNLEIGINLPVNFNVLEYLERNLLLYKVKLFERWNEKGGISIGYQCKLSQFSIKLYDKSLQFGLSYPLMRFEMRVVRMQKLKKHQVLSLSDLRDKAKVAGLVKELLDSWSQIYIIDENVYSKELTPVEKNFLEACSNINFWRSQIKLGYEEFLVSRNILQAIHHKHKSTFMNEIHQNINKQWNALFDHIQFVTDEVVLEQNPEYLPFR